MEADAVRAHGGVPQVRKHAGIMRLRRTAARYTVVLGERSQHEEIKQHLAAVFTTYWLIDVDAIFSNTMLPLGAHAAGWCGLETQRQPRRRHGRSVRSRCWTSRSGST